jgi:MFS family permease
MMPGVPAMGEPVTNDPRALLALENMSTRQVIAVALAVLLIALDGFDVLSISFASPGIAKDWGIDRTALGFVLSMEVIGMAIGSMMLGNVADRVGRRPTILVCLAVMAAGMFLATTATGVKPMSLYRFITGVGIGGMLAATNAVVAEFANDRRRNLCVTLMAAGYPLGAVGGGLIATHLLAGAAGAPCLPSVRWQRPPAFRSSGGCCRSRSAISCSASRGARSNVSTRRCSAWVTGQVEALPTSTAASRRVGSWLRLFEPGLARTTTLLTLAYFAHIMTFYFI